MIVVDAYGDGSSLPFYMTTLEFFEEVKSHLNDEGIMVVNVLAKDRRKNLFEPTVKTVDSVFGSTFFLQLKHYSTRTYGLV